jgi:hypothetical protein
MVGVIFITSGGNDLNDPVARQEHGPEQRLYDFPGRCRIGREPRRDVRCAQATGGLGPGRGYTGSDLQKDFVWHTGFWGERTNGSGGGWALPG